MSELVIPARVFEQMDEYLDQAKARSFKPKHFRVAEPLIRQLSTGTARLAEYRGVPFYCADEWSWGWMLRVSEQFHPWRESWFELRKEQL